MKRIGLLILLLLPLEAWAQVTVTKAQLRSQDQRRSELQLKDQLWSLFEPVDERGREGRPPPKRALTDTWLHGKPYATSVPGLCRRDTVMLRYAPDGKSALGGAHTPVRAYGIQATASYHFRKPPKGWSRETVDHGRSPWDRECEGLDWRKDDFFSGPDDEAANNGYYAMLLAGQALAAGKVKPDCKDMGRFDERSCDKVISDLLASVVSGVERCEPIPGEQCYRVSGGSDLLMRVVIGRDDAVTSVEVEQQIIMWHERID